MHHGASTAALQPGAEGRPLADPTRKDDTRRRVFFAFPAGYFELSKADQLAALGPLVDELLGEQGEDR